MTDDYNNNILYDVASTGTIMMTRTTTGTTLEQNYRKSCYPIRMMYPAIPTINVSWHGICIPFIVVEKYDTHIYIK